jgi:RNA-directed DNA polymerase
MNRVDSLQIRTLKHLQYRLYLTDSKLREILDGPERFYRTWNMEKNGKIREINEPLAPLRDAQKLLNKILQGIQLPAYMYGGLRGRSNIDNALSHTGRSAVLKADIKDFFPSVSRSRVYDVFRHRLKCSETVSDCLATLCTFRDHLPQGAPTSTILANFAIEHLAYRLYNLGIKHGATYTQFVDDVTISGPAYLAELEPTVRRIIEEEGFVCHPDKLFTVYECDEQTVTGVRTNHGIDAPAEKIKEVKDAIESLSLALANQVPTESQLKSLEGKIAYIRRLNKGTGKHLTRRFCSLKKAASQFAASGNPHGEGYPKRPL